jgi:hypothetical protein
MRGKPELKVREQIPWPAISTVKVLKEEFGFVTFARLPTVFRFGPNGSDQVPITKKGKTL